MADRKKNEVDALIREQGLAKVDTKDLIKITGNTFMGTAMVDGKERYFEIKVVAKADTFDKDELNALLTERTEVEKRKAETKAKAAAKAKKDADKRAAKKQ